MSNKRTNYINWDEYFMGVAKLSAMRSKDPSTQVGACIVSEDNRILSTGYNGAPNGIDDDDFSWNRDGAPLETKYMFVCHAELNAILNYKGSKHELENSRMYVNLFPCNECAKVIIQSGIKELIYFSDKYSNSDSAIAAKMMFESAGVKFRQMQEETHVLNF